MSSNSQHIEDYAPCARRLRKGRFSSTNQIYLITTVTRGRQPLFSDFQSARCLVAQLRQLDDLSMTLAFVIMPDHLHWLMQLREDAELSSVIQRLKSRSAKQINEIRGVKGSIWQKGFHDHALRQEEDLLGCARYIIANPLRAGLVRSVRQYPHWDAVWL